MSDSTGRLDVLIVRLAEELGERIHAKTTIDIRDALKDTAEQLIDDMEIPRVSITANDVVRGLLSVPDRSVGRSGVSRRPGVAARRKLRRVV
jgi:hypothetical protein